MANRSSVGFATILFYSRVHPVKHHDVLIFGKSRAVFGDLYLIYNIFRITFLPYFTAHTHTEADSRGA